MMSTTNADDFSNELVEIQSLPQLEQDQFTGLERDYLYLKLTSWGIILLLAAAGIITLHFVADLPLLWSLGAYAVVGIGILMIQVYGFKVKGYLLRQHDISYKSGLIFFSHTTVPFNRVQHVEVSQSPLGRLFDLASVQVYTAGGSSSDLSIGGLKVEEAHRLRDHITKKAEQYA